MPAYLDRLSRFVGDTRLEDLDPSTVTAAKTVVLDTLGAMLAGSRLPENKKLAQLAAKTGGQGPATLLGQRGSATAVFADIRVLFRCASSMALNRCESSTSPRVTSVVVITSAAGSTDRCTL